MTPLAVSTLAEGMMQDAWNHFSGAKDTAARDKVAIFVNNDIRRLSEVGQCTVFGVIIIICLIFIHRKGEVRKMSKIKTPELTQIYTQASVEHFISNIYSN